MLKDRIRAAYRGPRMEYGVIEDADDRIAEARRLKECLLKIDLVGIHTRDIDTLRYIVKRDMSHGIERVGFYAKLSRPVTNVYDNVQTIVATLGNFMMGPLLEIENVDEFIVNSTILRRNGTVAVMYNPESHVFSQTFPMESLSWDIWDSVFHPLMLLPRREINYILSSSHIPEELQRKIIRHQALKCDPENHEISFFLAKELEKLPLKEAYSLLQQNLEIAWAGGKIYPTIAAALERYDNTKSISRSVQTRAAVDRIIAYRQTSEMKQFCKELCFREAENGLRHAIGNLLIAYKEVAFTHGNADLHSSSVSYISYHVIRHLKNAERQVEFLRQTGNAVVQLKYIVEISYDLLRLVFRSHQPVVRIYKVPIKGPRCCMGMNS